MSTLRFADHSARHLMVLATTPMLRFLAPHGHRLDLTTSDSEVIHQIAHMLVDPIRLARRCPESAFERLVFSALLLNAPLTFQGIDATFVFKSPVLPIDEFLDDDPDLQARRVLSIRLKHGLMAFVSETHGRDSFLGIEQDDALLRQEVHLRASAWAYGNSTSASDGGLPLFQWELQRALRERWPQSLHFHCENQPNAKVHGAAICTLNLSKFGNEMGAWAEAILAYDRELKLRSSGMDEGGSIDDL